MGIVLGVMGTLLKIFLWVILILCILILLILFYPVKYQVAGEWKGTAKVRGRVHWFWFLVRIYFSYEEDFQWKIRILGLDLMKLLEGNRSGRGKNRRKSGGTGKGKADRRKVQKDAGEEREQQEARIGLEEKDVPRTVQTGTEESVGKEVQPEAKAESNGKEVQGDDGEESSWWERNPLRKWWHRIRHFVAGIKRLFRNLRRRAVFVKEMAALLREDNSRDLVCILKDNVVHLWRKLKPKVFRLHLLFGTGDPASTGEILGVLAILYAWYGEGLHIVPDFQRKVWEGDFFVKGRLSLFTLVLVILRVFLSDEWKCFKREYDKLMAGNYG